MQIQTVMTRPVKAEFMEIKTIADIAAAFDWMGSEEFTIKRIDKKGENRSGTIIRVGWIVVKERGTFKVYQYNHQFEYLFDLETICDAG